MYIHIYIYIYIRHQPSGRQVGLKWFQVKQPLSLSSPRGFDPTCLDLSRVIMIYAKCY